MSRVPLQPRRDDDPTLIADRLAQGRNPDFSRIEATDAERAAENPPPYRKATPMFSLPPKLTQIAKITLAIAAPALLILAALPATLIPAWVVLAVYAINVIAALLTGAAIPSPLGARSMVLQGTAAVTAGGVGGGLYELANAVGDGPLKSVVLAGSLILFALAGLTLPTSKAPEAK